jgi:hypothetical protein
MEELRPKIIEKDMMCDGDCGKVISKDSLVFVMEDGEDIWCMVHCVDCAVEFYMTELDEAKSNIRQAQAHLSRVDDEIKKFNKEKKKGGSKTKKK